MNGLADPHARPRIPRTIWALGFVSLFTDMGSEMVHSVLPVLLTGLGASALVIGMIEGSAEALVLVTKVFSGYLSDAIGKRKPLVLLGYGLATLVKPLFPLATSVGMVVTARLLDRLGKGIRGAPRDALVGDLAPAEIRGACFGLRQSMDTVGAVLGPLFAVALLWLTHDALRVVLWWAVLPGIVAVALLLKIPEPADIAARTAKLPLSRDGMARLGRPFWSLAMLGLLIALARFSEAFLVLRASERGLPLTAIPLVLVVMSVVYTLTAYPIGHLSDRVSRTLLLAIGLLVLAVADVVLGLADGFAGLFVGIGLWGLHMGLTQGLLAAMIADVAPAAHRGTAFGLFNLLSGAGLLGASILAGWLWDRHGPPATFFSGAALALAAAAGTLLIRRPHSIALGSTG